MRPRCRAEITSEIKPGWNCIVGSLAFPTCPFGQADAERGTPLSRPTAPCAPQYTQSPLCGLKLRFARPCACSFLRPRGSSLELSKIAPLSVLPNPALSDSEEPGCEVPLRSGTARAVSHDFGGLPESRPCRFVAPCSNHGVRAVLGSPTQPGPRTGRNLNEATPA
jgi:hypothetical protein